MLREYVAGARWLSKTEVWIPRMPITLKDISMSGSLFGPIGSSTRLELAAFASALPLPFKFLFFSVHRGRGFNGDGTFCLYFTTTYLLHSPHFRAPSARMIKLMLYKLL